MNNRIISDYTKFDFSKLQIKDSFTKLPQKQNEVKRFRARANYDSGNRGVWGVVSPDLEIDGISEGGSSYRVVANCILPKDDPSFINIITEIEDHVINHIYVNSRQIYGVNKSNAVIHSYHKSALAIHPQLGIPIIRFTFDLHERGTSFWAAKLNEEPEQLKYMTIDDLEKYSGTAALLVRLGGVIIEGNNKFYCDWVIEQVLFRAPLETPACLLVATDNEPDPVPTVLVEDLDLNDVDEDTTLEIPDSQLDKIFRKRLFLKF